MAGGRRKVVLVTGLSGAGLSTALAALEDLGYDAIKNLPLFLVEPLLASPELAGRPLAIEIDARSWGAAEGVGKRFDMLAEREDAELCLVFLEADGEVIQQRYSETRRPHPLAADRPIADGVKQEIRMLRPLRGRADTVIDTTGLSVHDLKRKLKGMFALEASEGLALFVTSFSYRKGLPRDADLVFDVRFLSNPHYVARLRPLTGLDRDVAAHVAADPGFAGFFARLTGLLEPLLPRYAEEGKSYLTIAVGCTGGRHRSVFVAEKLALWLKVLGHRVDIRHRDAGL